MTSTRAASSQSPTKRWWRRRGEIDAVPAGSIGFEFAHLLDPVDPVDTVGAVSGSADLDVQLDLPVSPDAACSTRAQEVIDLLAEEDPWTGAELAWADDGPPEPSADSDELWPFGDDELVDLAADDELVDLAPGVVPVDLAADVVVVDLVADVHPPGAPAITAGGDPTLADEIDALLAGPTRASPIVEAAEPEPVLEPVSAVLADTPAVSRFANAGVDDDRLPIVRGRRVKRSLHRTSAR